MDISLYKDETLPRRTRLAFNGGPVLTQADITESGLAFEECLNSGEDFTIGTAGAASLSFTLQSGVNLPELTGREFTWSEGIQTRAEEYPAYARKLNTRAVCRYHGFWYSGHGSAPFLRVWKEESGGLVRQENPVQPERAVCALLVWDGLLYCVHGDGEATAYTLEGMQTAGALTLDAWARDRLKRAAERSMNYAAIGDDIQEFTVETYNGVPSNLHVYTVSYATVGIFRAEKPEIRDGGKLELTAYDRMARFDVDVSEWLNSLSYPITAKAFLQSLCFRCGVELETASFCNDGYQIQRNISAEGVTGRQALQWVAELAASFARMTPAGKLSLGWYADKGYTLSMHDLWSVTPAEAAARKPDKLQIRGTENDVGVVVPPDEEGENAYIIENNPLLFAETDAELRPAAEAIWAAVRDVTYLPYKAEAAGNPFIRAGDIVTIQAYGQAFPALVMRKSSRGGRDTMEAAGNPVRAVQSSAVNVQIQRLRGLTNELSRTIEETKSTLTDSVNGLSTEVKQNAREISLKATKGKLISEINQSAEGIRIAASKLTLDGMVTFQNLKDGQTVISGSNIKTGYISADRISGGTLEGVHVISNGGYGIVELYNGAVWIRDCQLSQASGGALVMESYQSGTVIRAGGGDMLCVYPHGTVEVNGQFDVWGYNGRSFTVQNNGSVGVGGNFSVSGSKNCVQKTEHFGDRLINAYETAEYYFGDIGEDTVSGGKCEVKLDPVFLECVNTNAPYQVFLSPYGFGNIYVGERNPWGFTVYGDEIPFAWEVKVKRRGYESTRLEEYEEE